MPRLARPNASEALQHQWILSGASYTDEELWYPLNQASSSHDGDDTDGGEGSDAVEDEVSIVRRVGVSDELDVPLQPQRRYSS